MNNEFHNVTVISKANIYFDGKCVSHSIVCTDGSKKTVGVIFPSTLVFNTQAAEVMEVIAGQCRVTLDGESQSQSYATGQSFNVPAQSRFTIEVIETLDYVCHFE